MIGSIFKAIGEGLSLANKVFAEVFSPLRKSRRREEEKREALDALVREMAAKDDKKASDAVDDVRRSGP